MTAPASAVPAQSSGHEAGPRAPALPPVPAIARDATEWVTHPTRGCGECTACCEGWLTAKVRDQELTVGVGCRYRVPGGGCTIYDQRPEHPCRTFFCAWRLRGNPFPESFRPDRLGVVILAKPWHERIAYYLVPAGREIDPALLEWMRRYSSATGAPFLFRVGGRERGYGSAEFQHDLMERAQRGEALLPGLVAGGGTVRMIPLRDESAASSPQAPGSTPAAANAPD